MKPNTGRPALEDLHQALEFGCIFPILTPTENHHRLLEDTEPMSGIKDPCCYFFQMEIMPGVVLLDNADDGVFFPWKAGFKSLVVQLGNLTAKEREVIFGPLWIWAT